MLPLFETSNECVFLESRLNESIFNLFLVVSLLLSQDDLWTQRTLSTFQTFARGQEQKGGGHHHVSSSGMPTTASVVAEPALAPPPQLASSSAAPANLNGKTNGNGINGARFLGVVGNGGLGNGNGPHHYHHQPHHIPWNDSPPPPPPPPLGGGIVINGNGHASLSPTSSSSSGGSPKNSIASNRSIYRYIENNNKHHGSNNVSITHVNGTAGGNGLSDGNDYNNHHNQTNSMGRRTKPVIDSKFIHKPIPVAVPKLQSTSIIGGGGGNSTSANLNHHHRHNHTRSRSSEGHESLFPAGGALVIPPPAFSAPFPTSYNNGDSLQYSSMDSEFMGGYMPTQDDVC